MARQTRLELLVRRDDEGFEIREVPSSLAYLRYKPERVLESSYELARLPSPGAGQESYVLKNRATERYLLLTEPERFVWELMNGQTAIQALATAYVLRYGAFDFDVIPSLIAKLRHADLLTFRPASRLREALAGRRNPAARAVEVALRRLERLTVSSRRVHTTFERLHRWGGKFLFSLLALPLGVVMVGLGVVSAAGLWDQAAQVAAPLAQRPVLSLLGVKLSLLSTMAFHQIVHGLACVHYGRRVREYGFTLLHGFIPTFFVDVTDIFMASRRARVLTALSGALTHVFLASLHFGVAAQLPPGLLQSFVAMAGVLQLQALFISLYPFAFLEMDGYHILVDVLGLPTLRHDAWQFVRHEFWRRLAAFRGLTRREAIWAGYFVLCVLSIVAFVGLNLWGFLHASG